MAAGLLCLIIGKMLGPLIVAPFLVVTASSTSVNSTESFNSTIPRVNPLQEETNFMYAFVIGGCISVTLATVCLISYALGAIPQFQHSKETDKRKKQVTRPKGGKPLLVLISTLLVIFFAIVIIFSSNYGSYIPTYSVERLGYSKQTGAYVSAIYNFTKSMSRFVGIFIIRVVSSEKILFASLTVTTIGFLVFAVVVDIWGGIMWVGTVLVGFGNGNITPGGIAWSDQTFGGGLVGVIFGLGYRSGEVTGPIIIGYLFDYVSYDAFVYAMLAGGLICIGLMITLALLGKQYRKMASLEEGGGISSNETSPLLSEKQKT